MLSYREVKLHISYQLKPLHTGIIYELKPGSGQISCGNTLKMELDVVVSPSASEFDCCKHVVFIHMWRNPLGHSHLIFRFDFLPIAYSNSPDQSLKLGTDQNLRLGGWSFRPARPVKNEYPP